MATLLQWLHTNREKAKLSSSGQALKAEVKRCQEQGPRSGGADARPNEIAEAFMQAAASSALGGVRLKHGGPFGAAVVRDGVIISCAHNMVLHKGDPCCHAEMNAIQQACQTLRSHDLSGCDLYTTCEPCPMCWGAVQWSRLGKAYIGVDRHTAAKYGFDDKAFYDEIVSKAKHYGIARTGSMALKAGQERVLSMVDIYDGILKQDCEQFFKGVAIKRAAGAGVDEAQSTSKQVFNEEAGGNLPSTRPIAPAVAEHGKFMQMALAVAASGSTNLGAAAKERECFGAVVVKDGNVIATSCSRVLTDKDATATAEVLAIRSAAQRLGSYNREGCAMYVTVQPDLMSLGAILWSRISQVYCGVTQQFVAQQCGFEEGYLHLKDLLERESRSPYVATEVISGVATAECEAVFKEWSDRNGVIY